MAPPTFVPPTPTPPRLITRQSIAALRHTTLAPTVRNSSRALSVTSAPRLATSLSPARAPSSFLSDNAVGKPTGTIIVLFRSDLRLDDHPALSHALEEAATVVPVYCFDPRHFGRTDYGFEKTGRYRAKFLVESVKDLRQSLRDKGSDLVVRMGKPEEVLAELVKKTSAKEVYMHREVTFEEHKVEAAVNEALDGKAGVKMMWANTLYHEDDLPFRIDSMPDVYSDFREEVESKGTIRKPLPAPKEMPGISKGLEPGEIPTLTKLGISDVPITRVGVSGVNAVTGGETEALKRVKAYVDDAQKMAAQKSVRASVTAHLGADFSCRISPWLALGCISPRRIFEEMQKGTEKKELLLKSSTYYELVWRDFFRCITAKYSNKRSMAKGSKTKGAKALVGA